MRGPPFWLRGRGGSKKIVRWPPPPPLGNGNCEKFETTYLDDDDDDV